MRAQRDHGHGFLERAEILASRLFGIHHAGYGSGILGQRRSEVAEACKYVSLRLDQRITLDEVAGCLHLNPSYFSRMFKKETGVTFIEYVTRMKMERAKELLRQTDRTVGKSAKVWLTTM